MSSLKKMVLLLAIATALSVSGCAPSSNSQTTSTAPPVNLNISAAASLTDALKEINAIYIEKYPNVTITPNFASSGTLQTQIENGAPCDIFISAATKQMNNLDAKGLIVSDTCKNLLNNNVVLIVPKNSTLDITSFNDLALDKVKKIAIGDPAFVPAGDYGQQAFDLLGITDQVKSKYVMGSDVRAVLSYVESGNVDVGIVYSTDALISSNVKVVASAPDAINAKIVYPVAVIKNTAVLDAAKAYIDFLFTSEAAATFEKYGFSMAIQ